MLRLIKTLGTLGHIVNGLEPLGARNEMSCIEGVVPMQQCLMVMLLRKRLDLCIN